MAYDDTQTQLDSISYDEWNNFITQHKLRVIGPASSTDNAIARYDSTTGKVLQNSGVTIDDSNNIFVNSAGSISTPSISFNDADTGFYAPAEGQLGITCNGTNIAQWRTGGMYLLVAGSEGLPSIRLNDSNTG